MRSEVYLAGAALELDVCSTTAAYATSSAETFSMDMVPWDRNTLTIASSVKPKPIRVMNGVPFQNHRDLNPTESVFMVLPRLVLLSGEMLTL